jgi:hypothetical protein
MAPDQPGRINIRYPPTQEPEYFMTLELQSRVPVIWREVNILGVRSAPTLFPPVYWV